MPPRDSPISLAPDEDEEFIPVSPRKLANLLRDMEEMKEENRKLQEEIERLRPRLEKAREKNARLVDRADRLEEQLEGVGTPWPSSAPMRGLPSSSAFPPAASSSEPLRLSPRPDALREASLATPGRPDLGPSPTRHRECLR